VDGAQGSGGVEGISLTIADFDGETITIAILPAAYWRTNLHTLATGAPVNVEATFWSSSRSPRCSPRRSPNLELTEAGW